MWLNRTTNGAVDIAPEEIQYLTKQYGGQYATTLITQMQNDSLEKHTGLPIPGLVHDQDFYQQRELYDTLGQLDNANKRYNAVMDHAKENGATDQQARAQAEQMLLANPELRQQRQLYAQLASAASARAAAMKQLRDNKFLSPTGRELKMKQIDSTLRQTLDTVTNRMQ